jgi:cytidine deaminase
MTLDPALYALLVDEARNAATAAHCPFSGFPVGAAVATERGIFTGCNIENASFGLTMCAERVAIFSAIAHGARRIQALAVTCPNAEAGALHSRMSCGACRQVLAEFADPSAVIIVDQVGTFSLAQLLPEAFTFRP